MYDIQSVIISYKMMQHHILEQHDSEEDRSEARQWTGVYYSAQNIRKRRTNQSNDAQNKKLGIAIDEATSMSKLSMVDIGKIRNPEGSISSLFHKVSTFNSNSLLGNVQLGSDLNSKVVTTKILHMSRQLCCRAMSKIFMAMTMKWPRIWVTTKWYFHRVLW